YTVGDPINRLDPTGLCYVDATPEHQGETCAWTPAGGDPVRQRPFSDSDKPRPHSGGPHFISLISSLKRILDPRSNCYNDINAQLDTLPGIASIEDMESEVTTTGIAIWDATVHGVGSLKISQIVPGTPEQGTVTSFIEQNQDIA